MPTTPPFDEKDILYRFAPEDTPYLHYLCDVEDYVVEGPALHIWGLRRGTWREVSTEHWGVVMRRLLDDLTALREYIGSPGGPSYEELVRENDRLAKEREEYRAELEEYRNNTCV